MQSVSLAKLGVGLLPKLVGTTMLVIVVVGATNTILATRQLAAEMGDAYETNGEAIALALAAAAEQSAGTSLSALQSSIDSSKLITGVRYIYALDSDGATSVHTFSPTFPAGLDKINSIALGEELGQRRVKVARALDYRANAATLHVIDVAAPVAGGALGVVHVGMDRDEIDAKVASLRRTMIAWAAVIGLLGLALGYGLVMLAVVRPIRELTRVTSQIVDEGDLTQTINVRSGDEIGQLAGTFARMVEKLREIPIALRASTERLDSSVASLSMAAVEQTASITRQASAVQETQVTAQEIKQTSMLAAQKAEAVLKLADRAEGLGKSGEAAIEQTLTGLTDIRAQTGEIAQRIAALGERTRQIGSITETVKDLADQSNMLALNAAIEAVRSGEHGKGFSIVAREIRSLADQSIQATARVREILEDIAAAVQGVVSISDKGTQRIEAGLVQVKTSGESLRELSSIVRENSAAARQIAAAVSQKNAGISQVFTAVSEISKSMDEAVKRIESTQAATESLKTVTKQVSAVVQSFRVEGAASTPR